MRPNDDFFMKLCAMYAECSTCCKIQVGCVITRSSHILGTGYNGSAPGQEHCCDHFKDHMHFARWDHLFPKYNEEAFAEDFHKQHAKFSEENEIHAEINALSDAADRGVDVRGATLYCTYLPCFNCAKEIVRRGIARVVYQQEYKRPGSDTNSLDYLQKFLIVEQYEGVTP